jgi:hypothetical protein
LPDDSTTKGVREAAISDYRFKIANLKNPAVGQEPQSEFFNVKCLDGYHAGTHGRPPPALAYAANPVKMASPASGN